MEAIQSILDLAKATSPDEADEAMLKAHTAVNDLHLTKLKEMETDLAHRLGVMSAVHQQCSSIMSAEERRDEGPRCGSE